MVFREISGTRLIALSMKNSLLIVGFLLLPAIVVQAQIFTNYSVESTLTTLRCNDILDIAIDAQGNKWFGGESGLSEFDGTEWKTYTTSDGLP
jgi:hypothetical protein